MIPSSKPERFYYKQLPYAGKKAYLAIRKAAYSYDERLTLPCSISVASAAFRAFENDHPLLFFVKRNDAYQTTGNEVTLYLNYGMTKLQAKEMLSEIHRNLKPLIDQANSITDKRDRAAYIYESLANTLRYAPPRNKPPKRFNSILGRSLTDVNPFLTKDYNILGVIFEHTGVCAGISKLMQYVCAKCHIYCIYAYGIGGSVDRGLHAWNMLRINGRYTFCDLTFDLKSENYEASRRHLFLSANLMSENHTLSKDVSYPRSVYMGYTPLVHSLSELPALLNDTRYRHHNSASFTFSEPQSYKAVKEAVNRACHDYSYMLFSSGHKSRYLTLFWKAA